MGFVDTVKRKWEDVTGQTKAKETDRLVGEWAQVMHGYADKLDQLGNLYGSVSGQVQSLTARMDGMARLQRRANVALVVAVVSTGLSVGTLVYVLAR